MLANAIVQQLQRFRQASLGLSVLVICIGCRTTVPIHVWKPADVAAPANARIALMPIVGPPELAKRLEQEILAQRPASSEHIAIFTGEQLLESSPVRLASTASLNNDMAAIQAARAVGATLFLQGEILAANVDLNQEKPPENQNMNQVFFQRLGNANKAQKNENILINWRVVDGNSSQNLGAQSVTVWTKDAEKQYPDLAGLEDKSAMLIAASARETWKLISPTVYKDEVRLAKPWLQPGAWGVRRGVKAAKKGDWQLAEEHFQSVVNWFPYSAPAQHNLAVALAAREDFDSARMQLQNATGPFAFRLPGDTLFWLDQRHRKFQKAHGLGPPVNGWAFPEPAPQLPYEPATPVDIADLPWWTAIPFVKPPEWSWKNWLTQPIIL